MKVQQKDCDALERILNWLDEGDFNARIYGVVVGLLMRNDATRGRTEERLVSKWLDDYTSRVVIEDAASSGFGDEIAMLFAALNVTGLENAAALTAKTVDVSRVPGRDVLALMAESYSPAIAMRSFWSGLSDRDKALICAFDAYVVANESQAGQDAVREAVGNFDPANVPDNERFLLGVLMAAEGLAAA